MAYFCALHVCLHRSLLCKDCHYPCWIVVLNSACLEVRLTIATLLWEPVTVVYLSFHYYPEVLPLYYPSSVYSWVLAIMCEGVSNDLCMTMIMFPRRGEPKGLIRADSEASVETMAGDEEAPPPKPATPLLKRLFCNARDVTRHFDATVWMGDLNYRLEGSRQAIEFAVKQGRFQVGGPSSSPCCLSDCSLPAALWR
jgi:hypothetical protein